MMDDHELWDEVRKEIANAPERSAPAGAWDDFEQQLPTETTARSNALGSKLLWILLPIAFLLGTLMQETKSEYVLSDVGFSLEIADQSSIGNEVNNQHLTDVTQVDKQTLPNSATNEIAASNLEIEQIYEAVKSAKGKHASGGLSVNDAAVNRSTLLPDQLTQATELPKFAKSNVPEPFIDYPTFLTDEMVGKESQKGMVESNETSSIPPFANRDAQITGLILSPEWSPISEANEEELTTHAELFQKPINAHHRIILATGHDTPASYEQKPSFHLSYRGSAWLGNLSWMGHLSYYRTGFGEQLGSYRETDFNLSPYEESGVTITGYALEQAKVFAGVGLGYTFKVPSTRFSVYPFVSALYLISNNGEIRVNQFEAVTETETTKVYNYINNDSSPNRYLLHGGVDVQYQFNRRWAGAFSIQRNTTFAMESAHWQLRAGVHYVFD